MRRVYIRQFIKCTSVLCQHTYTNLIYVTFSWTHTALNISYASNVYNCITYQTLHNTIWLYMYNVSFSWFVRNWEPDRSTFHIHWYVIILYRIGVCASTEYTSWAFVSSSISGMRIYNRLLLSAIILIYIHQWCLWNIARPRDAKIADYSCEHFHSYAKDRLLISVFSIAYAFDRAFEITNRNRKSNNMRDKEKSWADQRKQSFD